MKRDRHDEEGKERAHAHAQGARGSSFAWIGWHDLRGNGSFIHEGGCVLVGAEGLGVTI